MSGMTIDKTVTVNPETKTKIEAAYQAMSDSEDIDGRLDRNAVRRYYRLIRSVSECTYVTCHHVEHNSANEPSYYRIAFGRAVA
jgi:hypothetical protein